MNTKQSSGSAALTLLEYIQKKHGGSQREFAKSVGVLPQQVTKWIAMGCIVVNDSLYSPRRDLK